MPLHTLEVPDEELFFSLRLEQRLLHQIVFDVLKQRLDQLLLWLVEGDDADRVSRKLRIVQSAGDLANDGLSFLEVRPDRCQLDSSRDVIALIADSTTTHKMPIDLDKGDALCRKILAGGGERAQVALIVLMIREGDQRLIFAAVVPRKHEIGNSRLNTFGQDALFITAKLASSGSSSSSVDATSATEVGGICFESPTKRPPVPDPAHRLREGPLSVTPHRRRRGQTVPDWRREIATAESGLARMQGVNLVITCQ